MTTNRRFVSPFQYARLLACPFCGYIKLV